MQVRFVPLIEENQINEKTILLFLIFSLSGCESYFFDQYKIIKPDL